LQDQPTTAQIESRFYTLFGHGWKSRVADAVGVTAATMSVQLSTGKIPPYLIAHLEWMESTPIKFWPDRWAELADRAKAKTKKEVKAA
jgi:hypothetical protein